MVINTPMFQSLALHLDFEGTKIIHVLHVLIWGFGGCWRFLTGVWHLDLDLDMVRNLAWIFPEVLISLRLGEGKIEVSVKAQLSFDKLCQGWVARWPGGWVVGFETRDQLKLGLSRSILGSY